MGGTLDLVSIPPTFIKHLFWEEGTGGAEEGSKLPTEHTHTRGLGGQLSVRTCPSRDVDTHTRTRTHSRTHAHTQTFCRLAPPASPVLLPQHLPQVLSVPFSRPLRSLGSAKTHTHSPHLRHRLLATQEDGAFSGRESSAPAQGVLTSALPTNARLWQTPFPRSLSGWRALI